MFTFFKDTHIDFMRWRYVTFAFSGLLTIVGILAIVFIWTGKANLGVDFSGGTGMEVEFARAVPADQLREALKTPDLQNVSQQYINEPGRYKYMLRMSSANLATEEVSARVMKILQERIPDNPATLLTSSDVGPTVSAELRQQALYAVFWAVVLILIYIWWRFDFRFAVAATIATFHDVLTVLGIFVLSGYEVSWLLITALLTLAGYSINDTIVVFDRIRENLRHRRKEEFKSLANLSINETLTRTVVTGCTTLLVLIVLLIAGGEVIHDFSLSMLVGIVIGTYSSIFVASAIVVEWDIRNPLPR